MRRIRLVVLSFTLGIGCLAKAEGPIRVAYVDPSGAEQERAGTLHNAMRENGRRAIYFDYYSSAEALTAD